MNKATISITENDEGIDVICDVDPDLTESQEAGEEPLNNVQLLAGLAMVTIGSVLDPEEDEKTSDEE